MNLLSLIKTAALIALASIAVDHAIAQCTPQVTARLGGDVPHLTSIDSNRILVANNRGLEIYNVSNAAAPVRTGRLEVGDVLGKMKVFGGKAYVVTGDGFNLVPQNIRVYSVSGAAPVFDSTFDTGDHIDFEFSGTDVYISKHPNGGQCTITAIDMSFGVPLFVGQLTLPAPSLYYSDVSISVSGSRAFVGYGLASTWRLAAINIADPAAMTLLGNYDNAVGSGMGKVVTSGNYAYVAHGTRVEILSLASFPSFPQLGTIANIGANDAAILGSTLYLASSYGGVRPYNLATPTAPTPYTPANTVGTSSDIEIVGDRLYNADREGGVTILQIGNPSAINQLGSIAAPFPSRIEDMVDIGTTLYVLDELGLRIFSTVAPDAPVLLGSVTLPDSAVHGCSSRTLGVFNGNAYITGCDDHLRVVNVTNSAAPFVRADLSGFDADYETAFSGNFAYFCGQSGVQIVNISNPSLPTVVGTYTLGGVATSIKILGSYLYLGTRDNGLWILSLANQTSPQLVGFSATPLLGSCYGLAVTGNTLFLGRGNGVEILDVTNRSNPLVIASMPDVRAGVYTPIIYRSGVLHLEGYVGNGYSEHGIHRIDVSSLTQPVVIGSLLGDYGAFTMIGSRTYVGDTSRSDMAISSLQTQWKPAFRRQPENIVPCRGSYALFNVNVSAEPAIVTYRWHKEGVPLPLGGRYVGSDQPNLTILSLVRGDAGNYTCVATNTCGATTSEVATLSFCFADFNCDETVDFFDYLDFVDAFSASLPAADFNEDGVIDFFDYLDFVDAFSIGC